MVMAAHLATVIYMAVESLYWKAYKRIIQKHMNIPKESEETVILLKKGIEKNCIETRKEEQQVNIYACEWNN